MKGRKESGERKDVISRLLRCSAPSCILNGGECAWPVLMVDGVALFLMDKLLGNMMHALKMTPKLLWRRHFEIFIFL